MSDRSDIEHARQMAAIHEARARVPGLSRDVRRAHGEMAGHYAAQARRLQAEQARRVEYDEIQVDKEGRPLVEPMTGAVRRRRVASQGEAPPLPWPAELTTCSGCRQERQ